MRGAKGEEGRLLSHHYFGKRRLDHVAETIESQRDVIAAFLLHASWKATISEQH